MEDELLCCLGLSEDIAENKLKGKEAGGKNKLLRFDGKGCPFFISLDCSQAASVISF